MGILIIYPLLILFIDTRMAFMKFFIFVDIYGYSCIFNFYSFVNFETS